MDVFVARQPILDSQGQIHAYELLFRESMDNTFKSSDGDLATSSLISRSFFLMDFNKLTMGKPAFINFTANLLKEGMATLLPKEQVVIEILEDVDPDPEIVEACKNLRAQGYQIALDDFVFRLDYFPLIELADIIKVDFRANQAFEVQNLIKRLKAKRIVFLAEKVETFAEYEEAKKIGYSLFQGYFFSKPNIVQSKEIPSSKLNYLRLLHQVNSPHAEIEQLDKIIRADVSLTYKLLKLINSSAIGLKHQISSIKQALVLLGLNEIKKWASVIVMGNIADDKPDALAIQSYVRASFAEKLAPKVGLADMKSNAYLMGLFSLIDACLDRPLPEILEELPIDSSVKNALLGQPNGYRYLLDLVMAYEQGEWPVVNRLLKKFGVAEDTIPQYYLK
ncbi:MAG: HDOD domain-containing protein, partial [Desulfitobacterium sp.]|nr:HDOD domain-containing protein [Desulfitobacterium sp.]